MIQYEGEKISDNDIMIAVKHKGSYRLLRAEYIECINEDVSELLESYVYELDTNTEVVLEVSA